MLQAREKYYPNLNQGISSKLDDLHAFNTHEFLAIEHVIGQDDFCLRVIFSQTRVSTQIRYLIKSAE